MSATATLPPSDFERDVDHIIALCLRYSWSEHEIVAELNKLRTKYAARLKAPNVQSL